MASEEDFPDCLDALKFVSHWTIRQSIEKWIKCDYHSFEVPENVQQARDVLKKTNTHAQLALEFHEDDEHSLESDLEKSKESQASLSNPLLLEMVGKE